VRAVIWVDVNVNATTNTHRPGLRLHARATIKNELKVCFAALAMTVT